MYTFVNILYIRELRTFLNPIRISSVHGNTPQKDLEYEQANVEVLGRAIRFSFS